MKRNYGIDLLRLVLMYMVVLLHVLGAGGVLRAAEPLSGQYAGAYLLEALAFCAVNGYGMITGYVSYGKKWRLAGLGQLWLQVLVYALGISACVCGCSGRNIFPWDSWLPILSRPIEPCIGISPLMSACSF